MKNLKKQTESKKSSVKILGFFAGLFCAYTLVLFTLMGPVGTEPNYVSKKTAGLLSGIFFVFIIALAIAYKFRPSNEEVKKPNNEDEFFGE